MTILIEGLKLGPIWCPTLNWAHPLVGCAADVTSHITCDCHVTVHIIAMSAAMSSLLSMSSSSQQPRHSSCHHCVTWQLNLRRNLYWANSATAPHPCFPLYLLPLPLREIEPVQALGPN